MRATTELVGTSCHLVHFCGSKNLQLSKTINCFSPMAAYILPLNTMTASSQEGFQVNYSLIPPSSVSKILQDVI